MDGDSGYLVDAKVVLYLQERRVHVLRSQALPRVGWAVSTGPAGASEGCL